MSKRGIGSNRNGKLNVSSGKRFVKSASENKKRIESKSNGSVKSVNGSRNSNASVVCVPENNVSKSACDAKSGMNRSSVSENDAWHASKNAWYGELLRLPPHHRLCPGYWLTLSLSHPFPSRLSYKPTREKQHLPIHNVVQTSCTRCGVAKQRSLLQETCTLCLFLATDTGEL